MDLNNALIKAYGTQIEDDLDIIKEKIAIVIAAHLWAETTGDNPLCIFNRLLQDIITE